MQRAKLIKQSKQIEQKPAEDNNKKETQRALIPKTLRTTQTWVKDFQKAKSTSPQQEFIALFS